MRGPHQRGRATCYAAVPCQVTKRDRSCPRCGGMMQSWGGLGWPWQAAFVETCAPAPALLAVAADLPPAVAVRAGLALSVVRPRKGVSPALEQLRGGHGAPGPLGAV